MDDRLRSSPKLEVRKENKGRVWEDPNYPSLSRETSNRKFQMVYLPLKVGARRTKNVPLNEESEITGYVY